VLSYTEIKPGKLIVLDGDPYEIVATSGVVKKQRQKPHNTVKMKNLQSGATVEKTFTQADKIVEAEITIRPIQYIYTDRGESMFNDPENPKNRFSLSQEVLGSSLDYIHEKDIVDARVFEDNIIGVKIPIKVALKVVESRRSSAKYSWQYFSWRK